MLPSLLKTAIRNLLRNKLFALINVVGLTAGICCILFISLYVSSELTYEKHFPDSDRIYRVTLERNYPDRVRLMASSPVTLVPTLLEHATEVESATRLHKLFFNNELQLSVGTETFNETRFLFADSNFFKVFSHEFIAGEAAGALDQPSSIVLTESTAKKYFNKTDVVGELIRFGTATLTVSGVIRDLPSTTHVHFDLLGRMELLPFLRNSIDNNEWNTFWVYSYMKVSEPSKDRIADLGKKIQGLADTYSAASMTQNYGADYAKNGHKLNFFLQPVEDIHLYSSLDAESEANGSMVYIRVLIGIAIIVLIISVINYVNLSTAKAAERAKEIGVRKTLGAANRAIRLQIFSESFLICLISLALSVGVIFLLWNEFSQLVGRQLVISQILKPIHVVFVLAFLGFLSVVAGLYPSAMFSSMQPARVLKGGLNTGTKGVRMRNGLMIVQFSITIAMITGSVAILRQMKYLETKGLGFDPEQVLVVKRSQVLGNNYQPFLDEVHNMPGFAGAGGAFTTPGNFLGSNVLQDVGNPEVTEVRANIVAVDFDYFETLKFTLAEGRAFSRDFADSNSVILNESAARAFGFKEALGSRITVANSQRVLTVVGIVEDFHFYSLHAAISPLVIIKAVPGQSTVIAVRADGPLNAGHIANLETAWKKLTDAPFNYSLLEDDLVKLYASDKSASRTFNVFTILAIIMSCIGLIGLTSYLAQQQLREMSIRRILGAAHIDIFSVFSIPFMKMTAVSMALAFSGSYFAISTWLNTYAYKEPVSLTVFLVSAALTILILMLTLSLQFGRFAKVEPMKLLKE